MRKVLKGLGISVVAIAAVSILVSGCDDHSTSKTSTGSSDKSSATSAPAINVTAMQLYTDYNKNEVAADQKYKGKSLTVSGTVQSIDKDVLKKIVIRLKTSNEFMPVDAYLNDKNESLAASLSKGQKVKFTCEGNGLLLQSPRLDDCVPS